MGDTVTMSNSTSLQLAHCKTARAHPFHIHPFPFHSLGLHSTSKGPQKLGGLSEERENNGRVGCVAT